MLQHSQISQTELREQIRQNKIRFAGNSKLKIYGTLACSSGKRMKRENRVFFATEAEAIAEGFRPCGRCVQEEYFKWKQKSGDPIESPHQTKPA